MKDTKICEKASGSGYEVLRFQHVRMKTSTVSLAFWFAQVLTLCALHENHTDLLTTPELDVSTTTSQTKQEVFTTTVTMTTVISAEELMSDGTPPVTPTPEPSGFTSSVGDDRRRNPKSAPLTRTS
ncbi:hypothetical protein QTP86_000238 [Hemibagrus guttatus]|nr:hypothetical protein QTP86_000238 [Hemibagrus guttatus]